MISGCRAEKIAIGVDAVDTHVPHPSRVSILKVFYLKVIMILWHINPSEKLSTSSEVPQNHNDLPSTRSQAIPP